jgi:hypothetical protein
MDFVSTSILVNFDDLTGNETLRIYSVYDQIIIDEFNIKDFILNNNRFEYFPTSIFDICPKVIKELYQNFAKEIEFYGHNLKNKNDLIVVQVYHKETDIRKIYKQVLIELKTLFI